MKLFTTILFLLSATCFAQRGYKITVDKVLSKKAKAFIAKSENIKLKAGITVYIPFTKKRYCKAVVQKVTGPLSLIDSRSCKFHSLIKEGQRVLVKRKIKRTTRKKIKFKRVIAKGPIYFDSGDLGSSTAIVTVPSGSRAPVGGRYIAESIFGDDCTLILTELRGETAVVDTAECPFERDLYLGQKFVPKL